jgi:hypothetical protein
MPFYVGRQPPYIHIIRPESGKGKNKGRAVPESSGKHERIEAEARKESAYERE